MSPWKARGWRLAYAVLYRVTMGMLRLCEWTARRLAVATVLSCGDIHHGGE